MEKQKAGFKFGKYKLTTLKIFGEITHNDRTYRLVKVQTSLGEIYHSLRLYNSSGKFIKQLLFEPEAHAPITELLIKNIP